jgi:hypothetical protein
MGGAGVREGAACALAGPANLLLNAFAPLTVKAERRKKSRLVMSEFGSGFSIVSGSRARANQALFRLPFIFF